MAGCSSRTLYCHGFNFGSPLRFNFHHARAATNKHHFGADAGLPVDVFRVDNAAIRLRLWSYLTFRHGSLFKAHPLSFPTWTQSWSAKVVDDSQLLLRSVSTLAKWMSGWGCGTGLASSAWGCGTGLASSAWSVMGCRKDSGRETGLRLVCSGRGFQKAEVWGLRGRAKHIRIACMRRPRYGRHLGSHLAQLRRG
ncbi:hypothetical protein B0T26DRAFT_263185 [Lasiosphaeria miniovina]|uniref:Uncharacterized protein n=1 Tax=Lasiosphaeria miniovina TaxID=1954250 RepID=A0AA40AX40_9PEZI|nr:uncharacterized protein B0T26DRAFT_263185 [Lasiosphaeria miniovina]KAK0723556.1 hypothetical protein B0T26DRAFT_263185 [Lasiosphaeria miniovina]